MTTSMKARLEKPMHVGAAERMIVGILDREYERKLVVHSEDAAYILHKKVRPHKHGHLGRRRPEQREALRIALKSLVKKGVVHQESLENGGVLLALAGKSRSVRSIDRTRPRRRASTNTRKKVA